QIYKHLSVCVVLPHVVPLDAMLPEFFIAPLYAPRGHVGQREAPITIWRSTSNYARSHLVMRLSHARQEKMSLPIQLSKPSQSFKNWNESCFDPYAVERNI